MRPVGAMTEGEMVPLYERRLHLRASGEGEVTIILDGSDGAGVAAWRPVAEALESICRVVRYDRAGHGRSDPAPSPPTADEGAQDLHRALASLGVRGPFVLVGHGYGASVLRCFAHRYRREVVGMVLLDARPPEFARLAPPSWRERAVPGRAPLARLMSLAHGVLMRRPPPRCTRPHPAPAGVAATAAGRDSTRVGTQTGVRFIENVSLEESDREVAALPELGDLPLIVYRHERPDLFLDLPADDAVRAEELWRRLQEEIAASSTRGVIRVAEGAGHDVPGERPGLVVAAVREVLPPIGSSRAST